MGGMKGDGGLKCSKHVYSVAYLCLTFFVTSWTIAHQAPLSMGFSRQEYWSGLPFPSPGDLPDPGLQHRSPALQADSLQSEPCELGYPQLKDDATEGTERVSNLTRVTELEFGSISDCAINKELLLLTCYIKN